ncbi:MAG: hypothetical protein AAGJ87_10500 [Pseudomonadota bacterium]
MSFLAPSPPPAPEIEIADTPSPTNDAVRRRAETARRARVRSGRASTLLTRGAARSDTGRLLSNTARSPNGQGANALAGARGGFAALAPGGLSRSLGSLF